MDSKDEHLIFLNGINGIGPRTINKFLNNLQNIKDLWSMSRKEIIKLGVKANKVDKFIKKKDEINKFSAEKLLAEKDMKYLTLYNEAYPDKIKHIYDPPPVIYYKGELNFNLPAVAVIGSRNSTLYGRRVASKTASKLAAKGINIISGLAKGIDSTAHKAALGVEAGITTAVLGNGFNYIYPSQNRLLTTQIAKRGLLITEFNPDVPPTASNFPRRNRIISALSDLILVVEAGKKSGTLITVDYALEQGKDVMAVPANLDRPTSIGCNNLLKKGALIFTGIQDILDYLKKYLQAEADKDDFQFPKEILDNIYPELDFEEKKVLKLFQHEIELYYEDIRKLSNLTTDKVDKILVKFELMDLIIRLKGKKYQFKGLQNLIKPI